MKIPPPTWAAYRRGRTRVLFMLMILGWAVISAPMLSIIHGPWPAVAFWITGMSMFGWAFWMETRSLRYQAYLSSCGLGWVGKALAATPAPPRRWLLSPRHGAGHPMLVEVMMVGGKMAHIWHLIDGGHVAYTDRSGQIHTVFGGGYTPDAVWRTENDGLPLPYIMTFRKVREYLDFTADEARIIFVGYSRRGGIVLAIEPCMPVPKSRQGIPAKPATSWPPASTRPSSTDRDGEQS